MKPFVIFLVFVCFIGNSSLLGQTGNNNLSQKGASDLAFPDGSWGVYSWFGLGKVSQEATPHIKGTPIILNWRKLEPQNGQFEFDKEIRKHLENLNSHDFNTFIMIWVAPSTNNVTATDTTWALTPTWIFRNGVPLVEFPETINPLGVTTKRYFPYYLDEDYKFFFHRMIDSLGNYICNLPVHLKNRILFLQSAEGSTGDGQPYKGTPIDSQYNISKEQWSAFRIETWKRYKSAFSIDGELQLPLLTNYDSNEEEQYRWMLDSLPKALGLKNGMFSHGYHISDAQQRLENFIQFRNEVEAAGKTFFARGEQDAEWKTYGWSTQNPKQAFYWSALYATHCGLTMWNVPWDACMGETYADAIQLFNQYAAETDPVLAKGAFCALRQGLDASDTVIFPEDSYGVAVKSNTQRYIDIAHAFSTYGANQGDPPKATGGGMDNRKRMDYNDVGWKILTGNYARHIKQIDAEETSIAWWQMDTSIYGRFARGFDAENDKSTMYFDVDDLYFMENQNKGDGWLKLKIIYFADDGGSWELKYHAIDGSMKTACAVNNELGQNWLTKEIIIEDALLDNGGPRGADLILQNTGNTSCRFHMIALERNAIAAEVSHQFPYGGIIHTIPGAIEAEHYDEGGEGNAYHDDTIKEGEITFRPEDFVDIVSRAAASNSYVVGFGEEGEWLEYTVEATPGIYDISLHYFCHTDPGEFTLSMDGTMLSQFSDLLNNGGEIPNVSTINDVVLPGGKKKLLRIEYTQGAGFDIDALSFTRIPVPVEGITIGPAPWKDLYIGNSHQLYATVSPAEATEKEVHWTSSDNSIAVVDSAGLITAISEGSAYISASTNDGGFADSCEVIVTEQRIKVSGVNLTNCPTDELNTGTSVRLFAEITPEDAENSSLSWSSSDPEVVSVNSNGWVTAVSEGTAAVVVTTEDGGLKDSCTINVVIPDVWVTGISIDNCPEDNIREGDSIYLTTTVYPPDASDKSLTWSSSDPSVAMVDAAGKVTALSQGVTSITALTNSGYYYDQCTMVIDPKVGIHKWNASTPGSVKIYPIPVKDFLHVSFSEPDPERSLDIYNVYGQLLASVQVDGEAFIIDSRIFNEDSLLILHIYSADSMQAFKICVNRNLP